MIEAMQERAVPPSRLGLGMAALGRPAYITVDHGQALVADRSVEAMRRRAFDVLDAGYAAGVRHVDAARSYGLAEEFVASWLSQRPDPSADVVVSSKWGYRYVGEWRLDVDVHETKDHSATAFRRQWDETRAVLSEHVELYQVHSVTPDSPALQDEELLEELADLRDSGVRIGLSTSGAHQADVLREALEVSVGDTALFSAVQATWNLRERSVGDALTEAYAAGWQVIVKEVLANGRLAGLHAPAPLASLATELDASADAVAIAAALALPSKPTVLLGAVSVEQLASNLNALALEGSGFVDRLSELEQSASVYWRERSSLSWQ